MDEKNSKRKKIVILSLCVLTIVVVSILGSYAYFLTAINNDNNQDAVINTGTMSLKFTDGEATITESLMLGEHVEKTFTIENTGTLDAYAKISWDDLVNTYLAKSLTYTLEYKTSDTADWQTAVTSRKNVPTSSSPSRQELANGLLIPTGNTYTYRLTIKLEDLPSINQEQDRNAMLSTKFILEEGGPTTEMVARQSKDSTEKIWGQSANIKKVVFESRINPKANAKYTYDLSKNEDKSIMSYLVPMEEDNTKYIAYIQSNGKILAPENSTGLFYNFTNLESIEGLNILDTSKVNNMETMFSNCSKLASLDVSNFDTSNVTNMWAMFYGCSSLTSLDLSNFDTGNTTNMRSMFSKCENLTTLNLSSFDTTNVTSMYAMFSYCSKLTILDISNFDTHNVTEMYSMFRECSSLTSLDVSSFNTAKVTDMGNMFDRCSGLTALDLSNFDTSKVTNIYEMFWSCSGLRMLNLKNFNVSAVTNKSYAFNRLSSSIKITVSSTTMRDWIITLSDIPKLTTSNFTVA